MVKHLENADWWDRALVMLALACFLLVVAYVVKRRVLDRVGGLVGWWVGGSYRLVKMAGGGGKAKKAVEVVPVVTAAASAASLTNRLEL